MQPDKQVADFDSATAMLRVLTNFLDGRDSPLADRYPSRAEPFFSGLLGVANRLPRRIKEKAYAASGWTEAVPPDRLGEVSAERLAEWVTSRYPHRRYPVVFTGSSNGAMIHLAALLGAAWLPQTLLIPVRRRGGHPEVSARQGLRLRRLRFGAPEDLSPAVADLYRHQFEHRGIPASRLPAESFLLIEPWWTLRTGSVPFWAVFNTEPSRQSLVAYLDQSDPYDEIRLTLFSHGVDSVGLASIDDWRRVLDRARKVRAFTGVDMRSYPRDFAVFARFRRDLARVRHRYPMPAEPMDVADAEDFLRKRPEADWTT